MAKKSTSIKFTKATIVKENGRYIVTEIEKENENSYDLSEVIDSLVGIEGMTISFDGNDEIKSLDE